MLTYISSLLLSVIFTIAVKNKRLECRGRLYSLLWLAMVPLAVVGAIRYYVGTDYTVYMQNQFKFILGLKEPGYWQVVDYEIGFEKLVQYCGNILGNVELFFPIVSIAFVLLISMFISNQSENEVLSIILFVLSCYYNFSFNIIRQTLATAIFLFAIRFIERRNWIVYMFCIVIAFTFHKTAILYVVVYYLSQCFISTPVRLLIVPVAFGLQFYLKNIIIFICSALNFYEGYINLSLSKTSRFPITLTIAYVAIYLLNIFFVSEKDRKTQKGKLYSLLETALIVMVLCGSVIQESTRIIFMFSPIYIVSIPYWFHRFKQTRVASFAKYCVIALFFYIYVYYIPLNNYGGTLPYQTIFSK